MALYIQKDLTFNGSTQSSTDAIWEQERDTELYSVSRENEGYKKCIIKKQNKKSCCF